MPDEVEISVVCRVDLSEPAATLTEEGGEKETICFLLDVKTSE